MPHACLVVLCGHGFCCRSVHWVCLLCLPAPLSTISLPPLFAGSVLRLSLPPCTISLLCLPAMPCAAAHYLHPISPSYLVYFVSCASAFVPVCIFSHIYLFLLSCAFWRVSICFVCLLDHAFASTHGMEHLTYPKGCLPPSSALTWCLLLPSFCLSAVLAPVAHLPATRPGMSGRDLLYRKAISRTCSFHLWAGQGGSSAAAA